MLNLCLIAVDTLKIPALSALVITNIIAGIANTKSGDGDGVKGKESVAHK
jgi:hypothetical protein